MTERGVNAPPWYFCGMNAPVPLPRWALTPRDAHALQRAHERHSAQLRAHDQDPAVPDKTTWSRLSERTRPVERSAPQHQPADRHTTRRRRDHRQQLETLVDLLS